MGLLIGIDGGGTRTTLALADGDGRELLRRTGRAGLVDPRRPAAAVSRLAALAREAFAEAGVEGPAAALCAGLAGVGGRRERETVERGLADAGVADRVRVCTDGETAMYGALGSGAGLLLIAGTGSVAWGRSEAGRVERCGGWGKIVGDEGSGYALGRAALGAALRAADGRGPQTALLQHLLEALGLPEPEAIPPWAGRVEKAEIAALAVHALDLAERGDSVARDLVRRTGAELAAHAEALASRLGPWSAGVPVVLHGGLARDRRFSTLLAGELTALPDDFAIREPQADAVAGAVGFARELAAA